MCELAHLHVCTQGPSCRMEPGMRSEEEMGYRVRGLGEEGLSYSRTLRSPRILNLKLASHFER